MAVPVRWRRLPCTRITLRTRSARCRSYCCHSRLKPTSTTSVPGPGTTLIS